jgi:hypothetical protein
VADDSSNIPQSDQEKNVLGFLEEALEEGESFVKAQENYDKIAPAIDMINGRQRDLRPTTLSSTQYNYAGKCGGDLVAMLTDTKPFWEYRTANRLYADHEANLGKLATHWWLSRHQDMRLADMLAYYAVGATSYAHIEFNPMLSGGGDLDMMAEDPRDVIPIRPNDNISIQNALGVMVRRPRTVNYLKRKYPSKSHLIVADTDSGGISLTLNSTRAGRILESLGGSPFLDRLWGRKPAAELRRIPTASCYTVYLHDDSVNETKDTILMGNWRKNEQGTWEALDNWSYEVEPDEMKYPRGRRIIATRTAVLKDGPNPYWHGLFPLPKLTLDPWPWTYLGKAPMWDLISLQRSLDRDMRIVDDHLEKAARPDVLADKNSISKQALTKIDTRRAGGKYMHNPLAGKGMQIVYPEPLDATVQWHVQFLCDGMDKLSGVAAMQSLLQLQQIPSAETMDKVIQTMSPGVRRDDGLQLRPVLHPADALDDSRTGGNHTRRHGLRSKVHHPRFHPRAGLRRKRNSHS